MTLSELIESLQDLADEIGEGKAAETEVRLAIQPRWPLESTLDGVALSTDLASGEDDHDDAPEDDDEVAVVYLLEGSQVGYAPSGIWHAAR